MTLPSRPPSSSSSLAINQGNDNDLSGSKATSTSPFIHSSFVKLGKEENPKSKFIHTLFLITSMVALVAIVSVTVTAMSSMMASTVTREDSGSVPIKVVSDSLRSSPSADSSTSSIALTADDTISRFGDIDSQITRRLNMDEDDQSSIVGEHGRQLMVQQVMTGFLWNAGKFVLKSLAKGALQKTGSEMTGWILGSSGEDYSEDLDEIKNQLQEQSQLLNEIKDSLAMISNELTRILDEILNAIEDATDKTMFETWRASLNQAIGRLNGYQDSLYLYTLVEPSSELQGDIQNLRTDLLNNVPGILAEIHEALMGGGYGESMFGMYARIKFKESSNINSFALDMATMFQYYYTYQIVGLQLWMEAWHASLGGQDTYQPIIRGLYYDIWVPRMITQIEEYNKRMPFENEIRSFTLSETTGSRNILGRVQDMFVDGGRLYAVNSTGWLNSYSATDGSDRFLVNGGMLLRNGYDYASPIFFRHQNDVYTATLENPQSRRLVMTRRDPRSLSVRQTAMLPGTWRSNTYILPRGFDVDTSTNTLWISQLTIKSDKLPHVPIQANLTAVDLPSMTYNPTKSFVLPGELSSQTTGPIQIITRSIAVVVTSTGGLGGPAEVSIVDLAEKKVLSTLPGQAARSWSDSKYGLTIETRWDNDIRSDNVVYISVIDRDSKDNKYRYYAVAVNKDRQNVAARTAASNGNIAYSAGFAAANYTLVERKSVMNVPMPESNKGGAVTMATSVGGKKSELYRLISPGTVKIYESSYPEEDPPRLCEPESGDDCDEIDMTMPSFT